MIRSSWTRPLGYVLLIPSGSVVFLDIARHLGGRDALYATDYSMKIFIALVGIYLIISSPQKESVRIATDARTAWVVLGLGFAVTAQTFFFMPWEPARESAPEMLFARINQVPELKQKLEEKLRGMRRGKEFDQWFSHELVRNGLRRLDNESLLKRAAWMNQILRNLDVETCAAFARGTANTAQVRAATKKLDAVSLKAWIDVTFKAAVAELQGTSNRMVSKQDIELAQEEFRRGLAQKELDRLAALPGDDAEVADSDACWTVRILYERVLEMREPHRSVMALHLVQR